MTAHAQLKALKDKYTRLLNASARNTFGFYPEAAAAQQAKEIAYEMFIDDLEDALREHEGD